ncbi:MAG: hypothetical protein EXR75_01245 [Myxococcales bacterium]|nr:hypothetical protein [Myxococcales bacterium]
MKKPEQEPRLGFQPGMVIGGKFALLEQVGKGAMGCVFLATDTRLNRQVAIKLVLPRFAREPEVMRRFLREAQATAAIVHPNVVGVYEMGEHSDGSYFIVHELLRGPSLREELNRSGRMSPESALDVVLPVISALERAHRMGIVHRDVKPENIVLTRGDGGAVIPKLIDFGVAKAPRLVRGTPTYDGEQLGTPAYMSPEQVHGDRSIDARTDIWAISAVLAEMITGERVFPGPSDAVTFVQILTETADRVAKAVGRLPSGIAPVVLRALAIAPTQRFSGMDELRIALQNGAGRSPLATYPTSSDDARRAAELATFLQTPLVFDEGRISRYREATREPSDDKDADDRAVVDPTQAATHALEQNQLREAVALAKRVLEGAPEPTVAGRMLLVVAIAQLWLGEFVECRDAARRAMELFDAGTTGWFVAAGQLATALGNLSRANELDQLLHDLRENVPNPRDSAAHTVAASRLGVALLQSGRMEDAEQLFEKFIRHASSETDRLVGAWQDVMRSTFAQQLGDPSGYLTYAERAVEQFTLKGDVRNACHQRVNLGDAYMQLGAYARAEQTFRELLVVAEPMQLMLTAPARVNLGFALARCGRLDAAHDVLELGLSQAVAHGMQRFAAAGSSYLAVVLAAAGKLERAEAVARRGVLDASVSRSLSAAAHAILAGTLLMQNRFAEALEPATIAARTLESLGTVEEGEMLIRLVHTTALATNGREDEAREAIMLASRRLRSRTRRIADAGWRKSFLRNVLENSRTLALARYWLEQPTEARHAARRLAGSILGVGSRVNSDGGSRPLIDDDASD